MGRPARPERRAEVLEAAARAVADRGIDGLSLAELAKALGRSTYTLTYHFGSKEQLLAAVAEHVEQTLQAELAPLAEDPGTPLPDLLRHYWRSTRAPQARPYLRLWLELVVLASRHPERFPGFRADAVTGWRTLAATALRARTGSDALATLIVAAITGLEIEVMLDPDPAAADAAFERLLALLEPALGAGRD